MIFLIEKLAWVVEIFMDFDVHFATNFSTVAIYSTQDQINRILNLARWVNPVG